MSREMNEQDKNDEEKINSHSKEEQLTIKEMEGEIEALKRELEELKDLNLRRQAEFENFRKRMQKEKESAIKFANENIIRDLVEFIDNLERAIDSQDNTKDANNLIEGIKLIKEEIINSLEKKHNIQAFGAVGDVFDPNKHEAISIENSDDEDTSKIKEVYQKGYLYKERVLRTAKVKVKQSNKVSK